MSLYVFCFDTVSQVITLRELSIENNVCINVNSQRTHLQKSLSVLSGLN